MSNNILCIYIFRKCLETDTKLVHIEVNVPDEELMAAISFVLTHCCLVSYVSTVCL